MSGRLVEWCWRAWMTFVFLGVAFTLYVGVTVISECIRLECVR